MWRGLCGRALGRTFGGVWCILWAIVGAAAGLLLAGLGRMAAVGNAEPWRDEPDDM